MKHHNNDKEVKNNNMKRNILYLTIIFVLLCTATAFAQADTATPNPTSTPWPCVNGVTYDH